MYRPAWQCGPTLCSVTAQPAIGDRERDTTGEARLGWRAPVLMFSALVLLFAATSTRGVGSTDDHAPAVEAWRIASAGTPWLEGALHGTHVAPDEWLHKVPNGHVVADRMAGPVLISIPFYALLDRDAHRFTLVPGGLAAAVFTAGTATLMFLALRRRLGHRVGGVCALAFALATPTWSVSADGPWTHTLTQFGLAGAAFGASRKSWWLTGLFLGVGILGRPHLALVAAVLGLGMSWSDRSLRPALRVGLPCVGALLFLLGWNQWMFGVWSVSSAGYAGHGLAAVGGPAVYPEIAGALGHFINYLGFLVAPDRGLFVWTPAVLFMIPAVLRARRHLPAWSWWLASGGGLYTLFQLQMSAFHGGGRFYGYRNALELMTCLLPVLAFSAAWVGRLGRVGLPVVVAVQTAMIAVGAATPALFVAATEVWRDNAYLMAVRGLPGPMVLWTVACALLGLWASRVFARRVGTSDISPDGYRRIPEPVD